VTADLTLPPALRARVLAAARSARAGGRALPAVPAIPPAEAFSRATDAFAGLLAALDDRQWGVPVLRDLDVQGLVGHLTGVEDDVRRALAGDPDVAGADHVASTQPAALRQAGLPPERTRRAWREAVDATLADVAGEGDVDRVVALHRVRLPLGALLVVRAFELWTHENDIRRAVGLAATVPDPATLQLMTRLAVRMLPHGVARVADGAVPVDLHLVLTGPGGGTWDVALGDRADDVPGEVPEVAIVADAVGFCRLVADRIAPDELAPHLRGAVEHAPRVLAGAAALALD
jgi:uncharacterized protein (TIGR03083 family)